MIFCFSELIVISFPSGEKIFAHFTSLSKVFSDGFIPSYVCESLVEKGATVTALVRRNSSSILKNIDHLKSDMEIIWGDIQDFGQMIKYTKGKI